jgi:hypothetical protein
MNSHDLPARMHKQHCLAQGINVVAGKLCQEEVILLFDRRQLRRQGVRQLCSRDSHSSIAQAFIPKGRSDSAGQNKLLQTLPMIVPGCNKTYPAA